MEHSPERHCSLHMQRDIACLKDQHCHSRVVFQVGQVPYEPSSFCLTVIAPCPASALCGLSPKDTARSRKVASMPYVFMSFRIACSVTPRGRIEF